MGIAQQKRCYSIRWAVSTLHVMRKRAPSGDERQTLDMVCQGRDRIYWSLKVMGTSTQLATGLPSARAGANRQVQTALVAVPSRIW